MRLGTEPAKVRVLPLLVARVKEAPAPESNLRLLSVRSEVRFGVTRVEPENAILVVAPETGAEPSLQLALAPRLSLAPAPFQVSKVAEEATMVSQVPVYPDTDTPVAPRTPEPTPEK